MHHPRRFSVVDPRRAGRPATADDDERADPPIVGADRAPETGDGRPDETAPDDPDGHASLVDDAVAPVTATVVPAFGT